MKTKFKAITIEGNIIDVASIQFMEDGSCIVNDEFPIDGKNLLQFTGLRDKNAKEIWEGDKFQVAKNKIYTVKWMDSGVSDHEWRGGMFVLYLNEKTFFPFDEYAMEHGQVIT